MRTNTQSESDWILPLLNQVSFGALAIVAAFQAAVIINRMRETSLDLKRTTNEQPPFHNAYYDRLFLLLSRVGFLILLIGTMIDNIRLLIGSFPSSWPQELWEAHPNGSLANLIWTSNDRQGLTLLAALYWFCIFAHEVLTSLGVYTITQVFYVSLARIAITNTTTSKAWRSRGSTNPRLWFWSTALLVAILGTVGLYGFCAGPLTGRLYLRAERNYFLLQTEVHHPIMRGLLTVVLWQCMVIVAGLTLWMYDDEEGKGRQIRDKQQRRRHALFVSVNVLCFCIHAAAGPRTDMPVSENFAEQMAFGTLLWYDGIYNNNECNKRTNKVGH